MNYRMVFNTLGKISSFISVLLFLPAIVAVIYGEQKSLHAFLITIVCCFVFGLLLSGLFKAKNKVIYAKEGLTIVALTWIIMSAFGALPFVISREIPSFVDAFFETVSGYTTTGASILTDIEAVSKSMLFWRSFTHWIGGMGVLVFVMAILPNITDRSIHIIRAEIPGPVNGKLMPKVRDTAKVLYLIYIALTALEIVLLCAGGMPFYESVVHSFGTAGTGGFGVKSDSIGSYSPSLQWIITIFMLLFGVNFNLYYLLLLKRFKTVLKSAELWCYVGIVVISVVLIFINIYPMYENSVNAVRDSAFQVSSIMTTTGYATTDFDLWPQFSKTILLLLMAIGACGGSTGGGLKVSRVVILFKMIGSELKKMLHPRSVSSVKFEGKKVDAATQKSVSMYFAVYVVCAVSVFFALSFEPFGIETNLSAVMACFNNIGPGFAAVGPTASYFEYSNFSKLILSFAMLMGRLEIFPLILVFSPSTWRKK